MSLPSIDSDKNYCGPCSPFGFPWGEPGESCCHCGAPMQLTDEQVSRGRAIRNRLYVAKQRRAACQTFEGFVAEAIERIACAMDIPRELLTEPYSRTGIVPSPLRSTVDKPSGECSLSGVGGRSR